MWVLSSSILTFWNKFSDYKNHKLQPFIIISYSFQLLWKWVFQIPEGTASHNFFGWKKFLAYCRRGFMQIGLKKIYNRTSCLPVPCVRGSNDVVTYDRIFWEQLGTQELDDPKFGLLQGLCWQGRVPGHPPKGVLTQPWGWGWFWTVTRWGTSWSWSLAQQTLNTKSIRKHVNRVNSEQDSTDLLNHT